MVLFFGWITGESGESMGSKSGMCSNESSDVGSSFNRSSSAVCKADVTLVEISWIIFRRIFESDDVRLLTVDSVCTRGCEYVRTRLVSVRIGDKEWSAGAVGDGAEAVGSALASDGIIFNVE